MTITVNLIGDTLPVIVDEQTARLGGSFYDEPLRVYAPTPLRWCYEQLMRFPEAVLLDVGASTGCYSLLAAHHPGLTVYAFEPVPLTAEVLRANVRLNGLEKRVKVFEAGVSYYDGKGTVHVVKADGGKGISIVNGNPAWHKDCDPLPVNVLTLDAFCGHKRIIPTFIKIDVEGGEKFVLEGARKTIEAHRPFLLLEHSAENIAQYGYQPSETIALLDGWRYAWTEQPGADIWALPPLSI